MGFKYTQIYFTNPDLNRLQANLTNVFNQINGPFIGGNLLTGISMMASTPNAIKHGLNRIPQIWTLTDLSAAAEVYRISWDTNFITLEATSNCTIAIWVN